MKKKDDRPIRTQDDWLDGGGLYLLIVLAVIIVAGGMFAIFV